jgi:hypothetical protein
LETKYYLKAAEHSAFFTATSPTVSLYSTLALGQMRLQGSKMSLVSMEFLVLLQTLAAFH